MELPMNLRKDILTTREMAEYLRTSTTTLVNAIQSGKIKGTQLTGKNGRWVVKQEDFLKYLEEIFVIQMDEGEESTPPKSIVEENSQQLKFGKINNIRKNVTCRVSLTTIEKIDIQRLKYLPMESRSAYLGRILDNMYVH